MQNKRSKQAILLFLLFFHKSRSQKLQSCMGTGFHVFVSLQQLMLMAVLNCLFDSLSQMLRYVCAGVTFLNYIILYEINISGKIKPVF